jgi:sugar transferase (PEP-CTERM system associated)
MVPILRHSFTKRIFNTLAFELFALNACFLLLVFSRTLVWSDTNQHAILTVLFAVSNTLAVQFSLWSFGLYSREVVYSGNRVLSNLIHSFLFSAILLVPVWWLFSLSGVRIFDITFRFYLFALVGFMSVIGVERSLVLRLCNGSPYLGNILILGTGAATRRVVAEARRRHGKTLGLVGILSEDPAEDGRSVGGCLVIGALPDIERVVRERAVRCILISMPPHSPALPLEFLLKSKLAGIMVLDASDFYETLGKKVLLERLDPVQFLLSEGLLMTRLRWLLKGSSEKLVAILILMASLPVALLTAAAIRLTSRGPVFYRQRRVGRDGKEFDLLKFRSMVEGAEQNGVAVWAQKGDSRVTVVGRFIRKFRIDEIPQLINVLRGEMAIVGPRPERPEFVASLAAQIPFYEKRHLVLPGITGWAQVAYPYGASVEDAREKLRYDLYYIKSMSFFFDAMIVLSTIRTVLFARGSR